MSSIILDNVKGEVCRQSSARVRGVDKYKGKCLFKVNKGDKYKVEWYANLIIPFCDEN